jgi:ATP-dependent exoDNAse (exonuclease V) alpha subunit
MYPVRSQAEAQTEFSVQICLAEPAALFAVLALSSADLQARTGHLSNESIHDTSTEGKLSRRKVPAFMDYKFKAIKAVNEKMASAAKASEAATIVVVMSFTMLEVRAYLIFSCQSRLSACDWC